MEGTKLEERYIYLLKDDNWILSTMNVSKNVSNPGPIFGVGLFVFSK
jgi:hypothetical protein